MTEPTRTDWRRRAWRAAGSASVAVKILGIVLALVVLLSLVIGWQIRTSLVDTLRQDLRNQALAVAAHVAAHASDPLNATDSASLDRLLSDTIHHTPDARYAAVLAADGHVVTTVGDTVAAGQMLAAGLPVVDSHGSVRAMDTIEGPLWEAAMPLHAPSDGVAVVGMSEAGLWSKVTDITTRIVTTTVLLALVGILAALALTWVITRPIVALVAAAERVGHGDYSARVTTWSNDEIGWLGESFNRMAERLGEAEAARAERDRLRQSLLEAVFHAQEDERRRISRELHDETGQALVSLRVGLQNAEAAATPEDTHRQLVALRQVTTDTMDQVRRLAVELRPAVLDDLGLVAALRRYVQDYQRRFAITVDLRTVAVEAGRAAPAAETAVYRIVQEALTNAAKHAGCSHISVLLQQRDDHLTVIVEDNGHGFDVGAALTGEGGPARLGLFGMQERAALVGGQLDIESRAGAGTTVYVRVPITPAADRS